MIILIMVTIILKKKDYYDHDHSNHIYHHHGKTALSPFSIFKKEEKQPQSKTHFNGDQHMPGIE